VQDHHAAQFIQRVGDPGAEQQLVRDDHAADVLCGADAVVGHEHLIVFGEGVVALEQVRVEVEALAGDQDDVLGVEVLGE